MQGTRRTILIGLRDLAIVLALLVWLARTDAMPQVVPPQVTDFIVDVTDILFGRQGGGAGAAVTDIAEMALYGEADRDVQRGLALYRARIENYFSRSADHLESLVSHPDIRKSLADFGDDLAGLYARDMLERMVGQYADLDEIVVWTDGRELARAGRADIVAFDRATVADAQLEEARKSYAPLVLPQAGNRFLLLASFFSPLREKSGYVAVLLNDRTIEKLLADFAGDADHALYLAVPAVRGWIGKVGPRQENLRRAWQDGKLTRELLGADRFVRVGDGIQRNIVAPIALGGGGEVLLGMTAPLADSDKIALLALRLTLLAATLFIVVWLVRRLGRGIWKIMRSRSLRERLLVHALEKSGQTARRIVEGTKNIARRPRAIRPRTLAVAEAAGTARESVPLAARTRRTEPDAVFIESDEPDAGKLRRIRLDENEKIRDGEFFVLDAAGIEIGSGPGEILAEPVDEPLDMGH